MSETENQPFIPPETKYYVDHHGNYLGGFSGSEPPSGSIEVATAPNDARQKWNGTVWLPYQAEDDSIPTSIWLKDLETGEPVQFEVRNGDFIKMQG